MQKDSTVQAEVHVSQGPMNRIFGVLAASFIIIAFISGFLYGKVSLYEKGFLAGNSGATTAGIQ